MPLFLFIDMMVKDYLSLYSDHHDFVTE